MNQAEIFARAADLIEERGWHQGWFVNDCGGLCAAGAIYAAVGLEPPPNLKALAMVAVYDAFYKSPRYEPGTDALESFAAHLAQALGYDFELDLPIWNDEQGRTKAEVVAALREAAEAAGAR